MKAGAPEWAALFLLAACAEAPPPLDIAKPSGTEDGTTQEDGETNDTLPDDGATADAVDGGGDPVVWGPPTPWAAADAWVMVPPADDPFGDRPPTVHCPFGYGEEDGIFEVETDACDYLAAGQPSLAAAHAGDRLDITWWHLDLWAPSPAQGHIALWAAGHVVWERFVDIPHIPALYQDEVALTQDIPAGDPLVLHLHNHGTNSWRVQSIELRRPHELTR